MHVALYKAPPPRDPDRNTTAMSVMLPAPAMEGMIATLRDSLITHSEGRGSERKVSEKSGGGMFFCCCCFIFSSRTHAPTFFLFRRLSAMSFVLSVRQTTPKSWRNGFGCTGHGRAVWRSKFARFAKGSSSRTGNAPSVMDAWFGRRTQ